MIKCMCVTKKLLFDDKRGVRFKLVLRSGRHHIYTQEFDVLGLSNNSVNFVADSYDKCGMVSVIMN